MRGGLDLGTHAGVSSAREGGTQLTLTHAGVPDTELGRGHQEGWTEIVRGIAKALE